MRTPRSQNVPSEAPCEEGPVMVCELRTRWRAPRKGQFLRFVRVSTPLIFVRMCCWFPILSATPH
jgi:hypothetical protein